ncbi:MAG: DeoR/GlpR transcriptional regulator, partial [Clostridia bacterium]|nr:DeoR/GlpR transcriptional regulator [Clostridia bacterium]
MKENIHSKDSITARAAEFLETGRSIFIDSGSTLQRIVPYVPNDRFTFTTTDPVSALELCKIGLPIVNVVGGRLDRDNQTITGLQATRFLSDINIDIALLSPSGLSARSGFTVGNYSECELKRIVVEKARLVIILMDSSKIDKSLPYTFCTFENIDVLITSSALPAEMDALARENGVRVINVEEEN